MRDSFVYIHVGPVRFTYLVRAPGRRECQLYTDNVSDVYQIFRRWRVLYSDYHIVPVVCPVYPMDFAVYNESLRSVVRRRSGVMGTLGEAANYSAWNRRLRGMVVVENRDIIDFNESHRVHTPFLHRFVFRRRHGRYVDRRDSLSDGLHPTRTTRAAWRREIARVRRLNIARWNARGQ